MRAGIRRAGLSGLRQQRRGRERHRLLHACGRLLSRDPLAGEKWTISANVVNIANTRYLLDTSNTFGGTHYINPRQIYGELRYRFHF